MSVVSFDVGLHCLSKAILQSYKMHIDSMSSYEHPVFSLTILRPPFSRRGSFSLIVRIF